MVEKWSSSIMEFQEFLAFQSQIKPFKAIPQKTCWGFIINESLTSSSAIKYNTEIFNSSQNKIVNEQLRFSKKSVQGHFCALHQTNKMTVPVDP